MSCDRWDARALFLTFSLFSSSLSVLRVLIVRVSCVCLFLRVRTYSITGCPVYPGSQFQYNAYHGMQLAVVSWDAVAQQQKMDVCFYSLENGGTMIDSFDMPQSSTAH